MKKSLVLFLTLIITPFVAGIYGILHDQFTYTISHEYYTKFKFYQFELVDQGSGTEAILPNPRLWVALVGFMATWWVGVFIGIGQGLVGLIHKDARTMRVMIVKAIIITLVVTAVTGLIGLCYGWFYLARAGVDWWLPDNLIDKKSFISVGSMHNFSYLGGLIGMVAGMGYQIYCAISTRRKASRFQTTIG